MMYMENCIHHALSQCGADDTENGTELVAGIENLLELVLCERMKSV